MQQCHLMVVDLGILQQGLLLLLRRHLQSSSETTHPVGQLKHGSYATTPSSTENRHPSVGQLIQGSYATMSLSNNSSGVPVVSIGMPVYNGEKYIRKAIDSILSQTFQDFELIISDNASTDRTQNICREYEKKDARVRYIRQNRNMGSANNFKYVFSQARGTYFMWAASDDYWDQNWIEVLIDSIREDDVCVMGGVRLICRDSVFSENQLKSYSNAWVRYFLEPEFASLKHFYIYGLFFKDKLNGVIDLMHDSYGQDVIFIYRIIFLGNLRSVCGAYLNYRVHSGGASYSDDLYSLKVSNRLRLLFFWQPVDLYKKYISNTPPGSKKWIVVLLLPVKWLLSQCYYLYKGQFLRRVFKIMVWPE